MTDDTDHSFEKIIEKAYWEFDAKRNGSMNRAPMAERDAFKQICRGLVNTAVDILDKIELENNEKH